MSKKNSIKYQIRNTKYKIYSGFTLIEVLVVIAIISILASLLTANYIGTRQRSRDAQRKAELRQIQAALESCRLESTTGYPASLTFGTGSIICNGQTYMTVIPKDPLCPSSGACPVGTQYTYAAVVASGVNISYTLRACLENVNDRERDGANSVCPAGKWSFTVRNP